MPARRLRYLAEARREVDDALQWYLARSRQAAEAFLRELEHAAVLIAESLGVWPRYEGESRRYVLRRFPFDIIYRESGRTIEVIALAHHKRKPGYWHRRTAG